MTQLILFMTVVFAASDKNTTSLTEKGCVVLCVSVNPSKKNAMIQLALLSIFCPG